MIIVLDGKNKAKYKEIFENMYKARYKVFYERLNWNVNVSDGKEIDEFDNDQARYILLVHKKVGVYGGIRLIPTNKDYMLKQVFPFLVNDRNKLSNTPSVWETSRFFVLKPDNNVIGSEDIKKASAKILGAVMELCLRSNVNKIVTVTDLRVERIFGSLGWKLERLGKPQELDNTWAIACEGIIDLDNYLAFREKNNLTNYLTYLSDKMFKKNLFS